MGFASAQPTYVRGSRAGLRAQLDEISALVSAGQIVCKARRRMERLVHVADQMEEPHEVELIGRGRASLRGCVRSSVERAAHVAAEDAILRDECRPNVSLQLQRSDRPNVR
jgi:hypothetical protein